MGAGEACAGERDGRPGAIASSPARAGPASGCARARRAPQIFLLLPAQGHPSLGRSRRCAPPAHGARPWLVASAPRRPTTRSRWPTFDEDLSISRPGSLQLAVGAGNLHPSVCVFLSPPLFWSHAAATSWINVWSAFRIGRRALRYALSCCHTPAGCLGDGPYRDLQGRARLKILANSVKMCNMSILRGFRRRKGLEQHRCSAEPITLPQICSAASGRRRAGPDAASGCLTAASWALPTAPPGVPAARHPDWAQLCPHKAPD